MPSRSILAAAVMAVCIPVSFAIAQTAGPSTAQTPYVLPVASGVTTTSIATNGNGVGTPDETYFNLDTNVKNYRFGGIPDGLGA